MKNALIVKKKVSKFLVYFFFILKAQGTLYNRKCITGNTYFIILFPGRQVHNSDNRQMGTVMDTAKLLINVHRVNKLIIKLIIASSSTLFLFGTFVAPY